jgi:GNAT superfamily N-acetyltransferase
MTGSRRAWLAEVRARFEQSIAQTLPGHGFRTDSAPGAWVFAAGATAVCMEVAARTDLPGGWHLASVRVEPVARRQGAASAALRALLGAADAVAAPITLTAERFGTGVWLRGALSDWQLRQWYSRHGFRRIPGGRWRHEPAGRG